MLSNRVRRNVWLVLGVLSLGAVADRAVRVAQGTLEWWNLVAVIVITLFCFRFYLCYRREVKRGNLIGPADRARKRGEETKP